MLTRFRAAALAAVSCLAFTSDAEALFITSNGDMEIGYGGSNSGGDPPTVNLTSFSGSDGSSYTNQITIGDATGGPFANGSFSLGSSIRTVSAYKIFGATTFSDGSPAPLGFTDGDVLAIISAVEGSVTDATVAEATFTAGRAFALKVDPTVFDEFDPSTWAGEFLAEYTIKPQEVVQPGIGGSLFTPFPANNTNVSVVNPEQSEVTDGSFLFTEDSTDAQNNLPGNFGDDLISNVDDNSPPGLVKVDESIFSIIQQTLKPFSLAFLGPYDAADLTALNGFAELAGFSDLGVDGGAALPSVDAVSAFASGIGLGGSDDETWNPVFGPGVTGDFEATLVVTQNHIGIQAVPEPTSTALVGMFLAIGGIAGWRKRRAGAAA